GLAYLPLAADPHPIDAPGFVLTLQFGEQDGQIGVRRQYPGKRLPLDRLGGREEQRLDDAQMHRIERRCRFLRRQAGVVDVDPCGMDHVSLTDTDDAIHDAPSPTTPCDSSLERSFRKISPNGAI